MYSKPRYHSAASTTIGLLGFILSIASAQAQVKTRLSIATGGTGGVYYPWEEAWPRSYQNTFPGSLDGF